MPSASTSAAGVRPHRGPRRPRIPRSPRSSWRPGDAGGDQAGRGNLARRRGWSARWSGGRVPGGVVGGIVGGLPQEAPPPAKLVRVGGQIKTPQLLKKVDPCTGAREAGACGRSSSWRRRWMPPTRAGRPDPPQRPLFDEAAVDAVKQWSYRPLLLNGVPTPFIVTVTSLPTSSPSPRTRHHEHATNGRIHADRLRRRHP